MELLYNVKESSHKIFLKMSNLLLISIGVLINNDL